MTKDPIVVELPTIDIRLMHLGEIDVLIDYADEMDTLLRARWDQKELRLSQEFRRDETPPEECEMTMQAEQNRHAQFTALLNAQVLLTAWAMLEGAVHHCAAFLAEQRSVRHRLGAPSDWPNELIPTRDVATEEVWEIYYSQILRLGFPLTAEQREAVRNMRRLRNTCGHMLYFEPWSTGRREDVLAQSGVDTELLGQIDSLTWADGLVGLPQARLAKEMIEAFRVHALGLHPAADRGISFWFRKR